MSAQVLLLTNQKGGVGKSTINGMMTYLLGKEGKKVLAVDFDPQINMTNMLRKTFNNKDNPISPFGKSINNGNIKPSIIHISDNIDLIPGDDKLANWPSNLNQKTDLRYNYLSEALEPIKKDYDYIIIDTPPTFNDVVYNAIIASDIVAIVLQTERNSFDSSKKAVKDLIEASEKFDTHFQFIGVFVSMLRRTRIDDYVLHDAEEYFGDALFETKVKARVRANAFTYFGITDQDFWDTRTIGMYNSLLTEIKERSK